jgi:hypothetical protein
MPLPSAITDLSATAASNYPAGSDSPTTADDVFRAHASFIRNLLDATQSNLYTAYTTGGTSTAYTLTPSPAITAYAARQAFEVTFNAACGAAPTLAISGLASPPNLVKQNGDGTYSNLAAGDITVNHRSRVTLLSASQALVERLPSGAATLASAGSYTLPGGLILKWGNVVTSGAGDVTATFATAFPNTFYAALVSPVDGSGSGNIVAALGAVSTTGINVGAYVGSTGARASSTVYYLAIGR